MSFGLSLTSMLDHDIKHVYSGRPRLPGYRMSYSFTSLEELKRMQYEKELKERRLRGKTTVYRKYRIQDAPAFRFLSRHQIDEMVDRLKSPKTKSQDTEESEESEESGSAPKTTTEKQTLLTQRLLTPTHTSRLRCEKDPEQIIKLNKCIESAGSLLPPSHSTNHL